MNRGEPLAVHRRSWALVLALQPAHRDMKSRRQHGGKASNRPGSSPHSICGHLGRIGLHRVVAVEPVGSGNLDSDGTEKSQLVEAIQETEGRL